MNSVVTPLTTNDKDKQLQSLRKKAISRMILMWVITAIVFIVLLAFFIWSAGEQTERDLVDEIIGIGLASIAFTSVTLWILNLSLYLPAYKQFNDLFKSQYVLSTIKDTGLFEEVSYQARAGFPHSDIFRWGVVDCGDEKYFRSEDLLSGIYQNTQFQMCDITTRRFDPTNKVKKVENVFFGQVMHFERFDHLKVSDGHLQIFQRNFFSAIRGWTAPHPIETENAVFTDRFEIYADNEHNAFYILTPSFMEKIIELAEILDEQLAITFCGSEMFVAISRIDSMFDATITDSIPQQKQKILQDVKLLQHTGDILLHQMAAR